MNDYKTAWPVIDGPMKGQEIASPHATFEVIASQDVASFDPLRETRLRYRLQFSEDGQRCVWTCNS